MSDQPKKRKWFQFHLSTAIVMMLVAGAWVGLNFTCTSRTKQETLYPDTPPLSGSPWSQVVCIDTSFRSKMGYGLPWAFLYTEVHETPDGYPAWLEVNIERDLGLAVELEPAWRFSVWPFLLDLLFTLASLAIVAIVCEWLIRRRLRKSRPAA